MVLARMTAPHLSRLATDRLVSQAADWLKSGFKPSAIWLFGSACRYELTEYSDLDLAVIFDSEAELRDARSRGIFRLSGSLNFPVDLLLMTRERFSQRTQIGGVCAVIGNEGTCLYDTQA